MRYAREHNLSRMVLGRRVKRWRWPGRPSLAEALVGAADDIDVLQVALPATGSGGAASRPALASAAVAGPWFWQGYAAALLICGATALLATPLMAVLELSNIVMLFLLAVVGVAVGYGRGPAVLAAFVGVGLFDFFFVQPRFSFAVSDVQYLVTFVVMLVVALVIGQLTAGLRLQAGSATLREHRVRSLYEMSRDLSAALQPEQVAEIGARFLKAEFGARSALLAADDANKLQTPPGATAAVDLGVAQRAYDHSQPAGCGTDTLPGSDCLVLPLKAPMRVRGVLAIEQIETTPARTLLGHLAHPLRGAAATPPGGALMGPERRRLLETCASLLAISLERIHYIDVAQRSTLQIESERLRNSLLSAISHDLRTPLAALVGLADKLELTRPPPTDAQREITRSIRQSALRMNSQVNNLLDMARLESGAVQMHLQWQPLEEVIGRARAAAAQALAGRLVQVRLADRLPLLNIDAVLSERVLVNLFENVARYTPAGSGIEIAAVVCGADVVLTIDDHGPGLPAGREEALFKKFERGRKESAAPGVGLGLAICRAIVEAHGGRINGETRSGGGARFSVTLPRGEPPSDDGSSDVAAAVQAA